jgi:1-acyl-sn-glycerol-3-phosphate acyltransferase
MIANILQRILLVPIRFLLIFFVRLKVEGQENLKGLENRGVIIAANHGSFIDPPLIAAALPINSPFLPLRFLAKEKFFKFPKIFFAGFLFYSLGAFPVKKGTGDLRITLKKGIEILNRRGTIAIFPEGRITKEGNLKNGVGQLQRGHRGVACLAQETGLPVVPVALKGNFKALKPSIFFLRKRWIKVIFGQPLFISKELSLEEGVDKVMEEIKKFLEN